MTGGEDSSRKLRLVTDRGEQGDAHHCLRPDLTWITSTPAKCTTATGAVYCSVLGEVHWGSLLLSALSCRLITDRSERGAGISGGGVLSLREGQRLFVLLVC